MEEKELIIKKLEEEGFSSVTVVPLEVGFDAGEHTHNEHTVHIILAGELVIADKEGTRTYKKGDRVEFPAGTVHSARVGSEAGSMIVGFKKD